MEGLESIKDDFYSHKKKFMNQSDFSWRSKMTLQYHGKPAGKITEKIREGPEP